MTQIWFAEAVILITGAIIFLGILLGLMAFVSVLRQKRVHQSERDYRVKPRTLRTLEMVAARVEDEDEPQTAEDLDERWRLPVQEGHPDLVNIMIEPDPGPTREQQNVRRLIAYLKNEVRQPTPESTRSA